MNEQVYHLGVKALIRNKDGKILLLQTNPKALKRYTGEPYWDIPGGRVKSGSDIKSTLVRELREETGIKSPGEIRHMMSVVSNITIPLTSQASYAGLVLDVYECRLNETPTIKISSEHIQSAWFNPSEAAKLLEVKYPQEFTERIALLETSNSQTTPITPGLYRHYKGHDYHVLGVAKHSETLEDLVVYETLYDNPTSKLWVRPLAMFVGDVEVDGKKVARFKFIGK